MTGVGCPAVEGWVSDKRETVILRLERVGDHPVVIVLVSGSCRGCG
jgi:hypothetical protein